MSIWKSAKRFGTTYNKILHLLIHIFGNREEGATSPIERVTLSCVRGESYTHLNNSSKDETNICASWLKNGMLEKL